MSRKKLAVIGLCLLAALAVLMTALSTIDLRSPARMDPDHPELNGKDFGEEGNIGFGALNTALFQAFGGNETCDKISDILLVLAIGSGFVFALVWLIQIFQCRRFDTVDTELYPLGFLYITTVILYIAFNRFSLNGAPYAVASGAELTLKSSFPSTHVLVMITFFGGAYLFLRSRILSRMLQKLTAIVLCGFTSIGVICRLFSGKHWFTDILGSVLLGLALLFFYEAIVLNFPRRIHRPKPEPPYRGEEAHTAYLDSYETGHRELERMARDYDRPPMNPGTDDRLRDPMTPFRANEKPRR